MIQNEEEFGKAQNMAMKEFQRNQISETNAILKHAILAQLPQNLKFYNTLHIKVNIHKTGGKSHGIKLVQMKWKNRDTSMEETVWKAEWEVNLLQIYCMIVKQIKG